MMMLESIKKAVENEYFDYFGIRVDSGIRYNVGDIANNSRQLFQDAEYDEDDELVYPYIEDGIYAGFYDGGELDGTCVIKFDNDDEESINTAIKLIKSYYYNGDTIHVLGGNYAEYGNDNGEIIIRDAQVLAVIQ